MGRGKTVYSFGATMSQIPLLSAPAPPSYPGIDIRVGSVEELIEELIAGTEEPTLVSADPPWRYQQAPGHSANPDNHYRTQDIMTIARNVARAYQAAGPRCRLALWITFPFVQLWEDAIRSQEVQLRCPGWRWRYVSGGSWTKLGGSGTGHHWIGQAELVQLYVKGKGLPMTWNGLTNAHVSYKGAHSEKPVEWMELWLKRWTNYGDLVVDLYCGLAPLARACLATGRRYVGVDISEQRVADAKLSLARFASDRGL